MNSLGALAAIEGVKGRSVFNSRGSPTIEIEISTTNFSSRVEAPSGASTGLHEVAPYPRGGVKAAVRMVEEVIAPKLLGLAIDKQEEIDRILNEIDGSGNFQNIGGNTAIAISLAVNKVAALTKGMPLFQHLLGEPFVRLPHPLGNVLGGGKHAGGKAPDIQEFLVLPVDVASFSEAAWANIHVHTRVRALLEKVDVTFTGGKSDEGAWAPNLENDKALEVVIQASEEVTNELGIKVGVGLDVASSSLWNERKGEYIYRRESNTRNAGEQIDHIVDLVRTYHLVYVEDPLHEEDFEGFAEITKKVDSCLICGDDLFTTNSTRLRRGIELKAGNSIIIKPNQIGTLTKTFETVKLAQTSHYTPVVSHRSGETCDTYLAHLAVGCSCPIIKVGVMGGERIAKINELLRIEEFMGENVRIAELRI